MRRSKTVTLTAEQMDCVAHMARKTLDELQKLLREQVEQLPPGDDRWGTTAETVALMHDAWLRLANAARG
jgi:hypothetical protein